MFITSTPDSASTDITLPWPKYAAIQKALTPSASYLLMSIILFWSMRDTKASLTIYFNSYESLTFLLLLLVSKGNSLDSILSFAQNWYHSTGLRPDQRNMACWLTVLHTWFLPNAQNQKVSTSTYLEFGLGRFITPRLFVTILRYFCLQIGISLLNIALSQKRQ